MQNISDWQLKMIDCLRWQLNAQAGILTIIVYGLHYAGELVINSLKGTDIKVICGIDKNAKNIVNDLLIIHPDEDCPKADAIVVTAVTAFIEIDEFLYEKVDCPIISLEDIIYSGGMTK